jgi:hypothetical protein
MWECRGGLVSLSLYRLYAQHLNLCQIVLRGASAIRQDRLAAKASSRRLEPAILARGQTPAALERLPCPPGG